MSLLCPSKAWDAEQSLVSCPHRPRARTVGRSLCLSVCFSLSNTGKPWLPGHALCFCLRTASSVLPSPFPCSPPGAGDMQGLTVRTALAAGDLIRNMKSPSSLASKCVCSRNGVQSMAPPPGTGKDGSSPFHTYVSTHIRSVVSPECCPVVMSFRRETQPCTSLLSLDSRT